MARPVLLYYEVLNFDPENCRRLERDFELVTLRDPDRDHGDELLRAEAVFAPLGWRFDAQRLLACPRLRVVASNTTGHPHIDVAAAAARGVQVITLKDDRAFLATITPTAEHAFGLLLAVVRNLVPAHAAVMRGEWSRWPWAGPAMLSRMSLGVVGHGRLGSRVAELGRAFGMQVGWYDPRPVRAAPGRSDDLHVLLANSDVVSLHVPHEPGNEHFFDSACFAAMRPGSFFVNTARGELVDEAALLSALESGQLAGAALDVLDGEFAPDFESRVSQNPLVRYAGTHSNLILTPHIAGSTRDAWRLTQARIIARVHAALEASR